MAWLTQEWERLKFMNGCTGPHDDDLLFRRGSGPLWSLRENLRKVYEKHVLPLENATLFAEVYDRPLASADFLAPPILLIVPSPGTRHRELVSQIVGCCVEDDGLVPRDGFTVIFNDDDSPEATSTIGRLALSDGDDPRQKRRVAGESNKANRSEDHWHYELSTARKPEPGHASFLESELLRKKKKKPRHGFTNNPYDDDDIYGDGNKDDDDEGLGAFGASDDNDWENEGPECRIVDGVALAKNHADLMNFNALVEEMGVGFLMDHLSGLCVASYPASKLTVVVAPELPVAKASSAGRFDVGGAGDNGDDEDDGETSIMDYSYASALRFFAAKADRIVFTVDTQSKFSPEGIAALESIRRWITKTSVDVHFPVPPVDQTKRRRGATGSTGKSNKSKKPKYAAEVRRTTRLVWNLGKIFGTRTKFPKIYGNLFRSASKVDSLFKRGEEDFCRDLFYLNQCSVLRKADEVCQRGDLSAVLAHLSNAMREDVPSFTLPFKLPGALNIPIPGTGSRIHIPLWNRTSRAKERILWSLEYYMIRVQRIVRRVPLSHYPAPDLLRDLLVYKDLCEIAYVPDDVIRHASVTSNDRVNKILARMIQICNVPGTQYDLKSKVFAGKADCYLLASKEKTLTAAVGFCFEDLLPDPFEKVTLSSFVSRIAGSGDDGIGPGVAERVAWMSHQGQDQKLTKQEFYSALHLLYLKKNGLDLPHLLPPRLVHPQDRKPTRANRLAEIEPREGDEAVMELLRRRSQSGRGQPGPTELPGEYHKRLAKAFSNRRNFHRSAGLAGPYDNMDYVLNEIENRRDGYDDPSQMWLTKRSRLGLTIAADSDANFIRPGLRLSSPSTKQLLRESTSENQTASFSNQSEGFVEDDSDEAARGLKAELMPRETSKNKDEKVQATEPAQLKFDSASSRRLWARKILQGNTSSVEEDEEEEGKVQAKKPEEEEEVAQKMPNLAFLTEESGFVEEDDEDTEPTTSKTLSQQFPEDEKKTYNTSQNRGIMRAENDKVERHGSSRFEVKPKAQVNTALRDSVVGENMIPPTRNASPVLLHSSLRSSPGRDVRTRLQQREDVTRIVKPNEEKVERSSLRSNPSGGTVTETSFLTESDASKTSVSQRQSQRNPSSRGPRSAVRVATSTVAEKHVAPEESVTESDTKIIKTRAENWRASEDSVMHLSEFGSKSSLVARESRRERQGASNGLSIRASQQKIAISRLSSAARRRSPTPGPLARAGGNSSKSKARSQSRSTTRSESSKATQPPSDFSERRPQQRDSSKKVQEGPVKRPGSQMRKNDQPPKERATPSKPVETSQSKPSNWWEVSQRRSTVERQTPQDEVRATQAQKPMVMPLDDADDTEPVSQPLDFLLEPADVTPSKVAGQGRTRDSRSSSRRWATSIPPLQTFSQKAEPRISPGAGDASEVDPYSDAISSRSNASRIRAKSAASATTKPRATVRATSRSAAAKPSNPGLRSSDPYGAVDAAGDKNGPVGSIVSTGQRNKELLALAINPRSIPSNMATNRRRLRA